MNDRAYNFLIGVLGADGAHAFKKAIDRESSLSDAVVPRAILSWLSVATLANYEGGVPGVENTYLSFKKSERGLDGAISIGADVYSFTGASTFHVAASVAVALGVNQTGARTIRDQVLAKVGKSIDTLVKARIVTEQLEKKGLTMKCDCGKTEHLPACATRMKKGGTELPGATAKPKTQEMAMAPQAPMPINSQKQKPKPFTVTKSEAAHKCGMCARTSFANGLYVGCLCLRDMASMVKTERTDSGYSLTFSSPEWDTDAVAALRAALRG